MGGTAVAVSGIPTPISFSVDANGLLVAEEVLRNTDQGESEEAYHNRLLIEGITNFRYLITDTLFQGYNPGEVEIIFAAGALATADRIENKRRSKKYKVLGTTAGLQYPKHQTAVDITRINTDGYIDVTFYPTYGHQLDLNSINGDEFALSAPQGSTAAIVGTPQRQGDTHTYRYLFTGAFSVGEVRLDFNPNSFSDDGPFSNVAFSQGFTVEAVAVGLEDPVDAETIGLTRINDNRGYVDVPIQVPYGGVLDEKSVTDLEPEFALTGAGASDVFLDNDQAPIRLLHFVSI